MIEYKNIQRYENLEFGSYLKLPGFSHSFLKQQHNGVAEDLKLNDNIRIGKLVDDIITQPERVKMDNPLYPAARDIARKLTDTFGDLFNQFQKQVSFTADASFRPSELHEEFKLKVTGRLDFLLPKNAVIDLKVTQSKNLLALIAFMGYENQLWNYAKMAQVKKAYLMIYSIPLKGTFIYPVDCSHNYNEFWADKIIHFGKVN